MKTRPARARFFRFSDRALAGSDVGSDQLAHGDRGVGHAVREAPFVVIPGQDAAKLALHHLGLVHVEDRAVAVVVEVRGNQRLVGIAQDALQRAVGGGADGLVDFLDRGVAGGFEDQVHDRDVGRRHADRHAVQAALEFGQHQAHGLGRAGRGRDHRQRRGAGAIQILVHGVERRLVAGIAVDRGHEAAGDADRIVQHLGHRRQAVRRAAGVRDDDVVLCQRVVVHAEDDGLVGIVAGGRDQHPLGAGRQVRLHLFLGGEDAGAFHDDVDVAPGQVGRVADRRDLDRTAADVDRIARNRDLGGEAAVDRVVAQQMRIGFDRAQVVDRHDLDIIAPRFDDRAQHVPTDPAKAVDRYLDSHRFPPPLMMFALQIARIAGGMQMPASGRGGNSAERGVPGAWLRRMVAAAAPGRRRGWPARAAQAACRGAECCRAANRGAEVSARS